MGIYYSTDTVDTNECDKCEGSRLQQQAELPHGQSMQWRESKRPQWRFKAEYNSSFRTTFMMASSANFGGES